MSARDALPVLDATVRLYDVTITFDEGATEHRRAWAATPAGAYSLARYDVFLASPLGNAYGKPLGWTAELAKV